MLFRSTLDEPWLSLRQAYHSLRQRWGELLTRVDLSLSEYGVLELCARSPARASEVARAIGITPAGATDVIDRLERRRFVRRIADPTDRRAVRVELTDAGVRIHREVIVARRSVLQEIDRAMPESERRSLVLGLTALVRALSEDPA